MSPSMLSKAIAKERLTQPALAQRIAAYTRSLGGPVLEPTPQMISRWQQGHARPSQVYVAALAAVLDLDEQALDADFAKHAANHPKHRRMETSLSVTDPLLLVKAAMRRRDALKLGAVTFGGAGFTLIDPEPLRALQALGRRAAPAGYLDGLEATIDHYASALWGYEPALLDSELSGYFTEVRLLLEGPGVGSDWSRLCWLGAKLAVLVAYLRWMTGRRADAGAFYQSALELADQAGDRRLLAQVIGDQAMLAFHDRRFAESAEIAGQGQRLTDDPVIVTRLACQEARAAARIGETGKAKAAVAVARGHLDDGDLGPTEDRFSYPMTNALVQVSTAVLWLGDPKSAKALALASIDASTGLRDQTSNVPHARLAAAAADARLGDLDAAAGEASAVLSADLKVDAVAILSRARGLLDDLAPRAEERTVHDYRELLGTVARRIPVSG